MKKTIKLRTTGATDSYIITVPKGFIKTLKWKKSQKLNIKQTAKGLVVEDWKE